jgi:hypothetical protein
LASADSSFIASLLRLLHEQLDRRLAPGAQRAAAEAAGEALGAGDAHALDLAGLAVEHAHARLCFRMPVTTLGRAGLVVVVAQHRDDGDRDRVQFVGQHARLLGGAVVGEVAAQQQHVGRLGGLGEEAAQVPAESLVTWMSPTAAKRTDGTGGFPHGQMLPPAERRPCCIGTAARL